jgi:predicted CoA-binding protein
MSEDACPLPTDPAERELQAIRRMLSAKRIAVVGLSDDPGRPSHGVASYLKSAGKEIIPINPSHERVMGLQCYPSLEEAAQAGGGPIEVVDVFRRPEYCADVVRSAIAVGAKGVWLQSGIVSDEAQELAARAGIDFVQDRCMMVDHMYRR